MDLSGQSLGRYHLIGPLGQGGMATVYKAFDTRLERDVAIKIIRIDAFPQNQIEHILQRFDREAKALARLSHLHIIKVIDYGEHNGAPFLVMEYLPGGTLKEKLNHPIPWKDAVQTLLPIAQALEYAHERKIIHRDVKPSNILLTEKGHPMLTDFGIAKILDLADGQTLTGTGVGIGTPEYMSPEQGMGREVDARSDVYSLGIVFYEMITGKRPYTADTPMAVVLKHLTDPLPHPGEIIRDLPESVAKVILKALAKHSEDRYESMGAFIAALERLLDGNNQAELSTLTQPDPFVTINYPIEPQNTVVEELSPTIAGYTPEKSPGQQRSQQMMLAGLALLIVVGIIVVAGWIMGGMPAALATFEPTTETYNVALSTSTPAAQAEIQSATPTQTRVLPRATATLSPTAIPTSNPFLSTPPQGARLRVGKGIIYRLCFSPQGNLLAVSTGSGVYLYRYPGMEIAEIIPDVSSSIAFSQDGSQLLIGENLWDVDPAKRVKQLKNDSRVELYASTFIDNVPYVIDSSKPTDRVIDFWNVLSGEKTGSVFRENTWNYSPIFSSDGKYLAINTARIIDGISDGMRLEVLDSQTRAIVFKYDDGFSRVAFSGNNNLMAMTGYGHIQVIDLEQSRVRTFNTPGNESDYYGSTVAMSIDGKYLAALQNKNTLNIWDIDKGSIVASIDVEMPGEYVFSPDNQFLILTDNMNIKVLNWASEQTVNQISGFGLPVQGVAISNDGKIVANLNDRYIPNSDFLMKFDVPIDDVKNIEIPKAPLRILALSQDGSLAIGYQPSSDKKTVLWSISSNQITSWTDTDPKPSYYNSISPDNTLLGIYTDIVSISSRKKVYSIVVEDWVSGSLAFSRDNRFAAYCERRYSKWDPKTHTNTKSDFTVIIELKQMRQIKTVNGCNPTFSSDGSLIATYGNTVTVMDTLTGNVIYTYDAPQDEISSRAFLPDNNTFVYGLTNGTLLWINAKTGERKEYKAHGDAITGIAFDQKQNLLVTCSEDGTVVIWDLKSLTQ
jgi:serine/threonine protein kinase/WD40 repeat protein